MMKSKPDDEDYWNYSMFNAFTFDDEDEVSRVSLEQVWVLVCSRF